MLNVLKQVISLAAIDLPSCSQRIQPAVRGAIPRKEESLDGRSVGARSVVVEKQHGDRAQDDFSKEKVQFTFQHTERHPEIQGLVELLELVAC